MLSLLWKDWQDTVEQNRRSCHGQVQNVLSPAGPSTSSLRCTSQLCMLKEVINTSIFSSSLSRTPTAQSDGKNIISTIIKQRLTHHRTTEEINVIPIAGGGIAVAFVWIWAILSDTLRTRWTLIITQSLIGLIPAITMTLWTSNPSSVPVSAAYAAYFISYLSLGTAPLIFSWLSELIPQDPEARSLIVGTSVAGYYAVSAWSGILIWPASEAPYYRCGWQTALSLWLVVIAMTCVLRFVDVRYLMPKRKLFVAEVLHGDAVQESEIAPEHDDDRDVDSLKGKDVGVAVSRV